MAKSFVCSVRFTVRPKVKPREPSRLHCEPLASRVDPLAIEPHFLACNIEALDGRSRLQWDMPLFTRLGVDALIPEAIKTPLRLELNSHGIGWLGRGESGDVCCVEPLGIDEPMDVRTLTHARAIELQLVGQPFQRIASNRRARWVPGLPVEITEFEQLAKKVECLREMVAHGCPIGAAISPGSVYEDVRFAVDSGFDYISLLLDIQYDFHANGGSLALAPLESTLEMALKGIQDSGSKIRLLVSANISDGFELFRCLQMGAAAVSIDAYLASRKPAEVAARKETFGSVLSNYAPVAVPPLGWVTTAVHRLREELQDCAFYAGKA